MYKEVELRITPEEAHDREHVNELLASMLHVGKERILHVEILRKSIDARQRKVVIQLKVGVHVDRIEQKERGFVPQYRDVSSAATVVVVGGRTCRIVCRIALDRVREKTDCAGKGEMCGGTETGFESIIQNRDC